MGKAQTSAFQNRELSWLQFNRRVQSEADQPNNPLLERAKFLAIVTSNLDEFIQVRYPKVFRAAKGKKAEKKQLGGLTSKELYHKVNKEILSQNNQQYLLFDGISSELYLHGIRLYPVFSLSHTQSDREKALFHDSILPFLKELPEDVPVSQKQLHLCVKLTRSRGRKSRFALVALPASLPRVYDLSETRDDQCLIGLEDVVRHHVSALFPRETVEHCGVFRILRNQNFELPECTPEGMEGAVREMLGMRRSGQVLRLEAEERMSEEMLTWLMKHLEVEREQRYRVTGPLDLNKLMMAVYGMVKRPELKYTPVPPKGRAGADGRRYFRPDRRKGLSAVPPLPQLRPGGASGGAGGGGSCRAHHPARPCTGYPATAPSWRRWPGRRKTASRSMCCLKARPGLTRKTTCSGASGFAGQAAGSASASRGSSVTARSRSSSGRRTAAGSARFIWARAIITTPPPSSTPISAF